MTFVSARVATGIAVLVASIWFASAAQAATVEVIDGTVVFSAAPGEANDVNALSTGVPSFGVRIGDAGASLAVVGPGCDRLDEHTATCPEEREGSLGLSIDTGDGDDHVRVEDATHRGNVIIRGGKGDDAIHSGEARGGNSPQLYGGPGNDQLAVFNNGYGEPVLHGGSGNDSLSIPELGGGSMFGDEGDDDLAFGGDTGRDSAVPVVLDGGGGDDDLTALSGGGGGNLILHGGAGADSLSVNDKAVLMFGDAGSDRLTFEGITQDPAHVRLDGGGGNDTYGFTQAFDRPATFAAQMLVAGPGLDTLDQRNADWPITFDMSNCPGCVEQVVGSPFADHITGDGGAQIIQGGDGGDVLDGGGGIDLIAGQEGDDTITARDRAIDVVGCDGGVDTVVADRFDLVGRDCETITRGV